MAAYEVYPGVVFDPEASDPHASAQSARSASSPAVTIAGTRIPVWKALDALAYARDLKLLWQGLRLTIEGQTLTDEQLSTAFRYVTEILSRLEDMEIEQFREHAGQGRGRAEPIEMAPGVVSYPGIWSGKPMIAGTRLPASQVVEELGAGDLVSEFLAEDGYRLTEQQIRDSLAYAAFVARDVDSELNARDNSGSSDGR